LKPNHHLDYSTILAYAAGTLNEAFTVVAASHIAVCSTCREAVRAAEAVGGELLEAMADADVSADCRARTLAALEQATLHRLPLPAPRSQLPAPLARLIQTGNFDDIAWKKKAPGVAMFDVKLPAEAKGQRERFCASAPAAPCRNMATAARRSR